MKKTAALFLLSVGVNCMTAQDIVPVHEFDIDIQKVGSPIQSTMYGIFFEDINFGADGGLYAELIKNRSFEFENPWGGWEPFGDVSIAEKNPCFNKNPHYAHLTYTGQITGTGLENEGFKGIGIKADENYDFSLYARTETNNPIKLRIELVNRDNDIYETQHLEIKGKDWKKYSVILSPKATEAKSRLRITMETAGTLDMEHISLFPEKTFNNRTNGLRRDLAQARSHAQGQYAAGGVQPVCTQQVAGAVLKGLPGRHPRVGRKAPAQFRPKGQQGAAVFIPQQQGHGPVGQALAQHAGRVQQADGGIAFVHHLQQEAAGRVLEGVGGGYAYTACGRHWSCP